MDKKHQDKLSELSEIIYTEVMNKYGVLTAGDYKSRFSIEEVADLYVILKETCTLLMATPLAFLRPGKEEERILEFSDNLRNIIPDIRNRPGFEKKYDIDNILPITIQLKEKEQAKQQFYISVRQKYFGELYPVSGPYNTCEEAENDLDCQIDAYKSSLNKDEYLSIVCKKD